MPGIRLTADKLNRAHESVRKVIECPELSESDVRHLSNTLRLLDQLWAEVRVTAG